MLDPTTALGAARRLAALVSANHRTVPVEEAWRLATKLGIGVRLLCGVQLDTRPIRVSLSTIDPAPYVRLSAHPDRATIFRSEIFLVDREQVGPEEWDYAAKVSDVRERYDLELRLDERTQRLRLVPAAFCVQDQCGWEEDLERGAATAAVWTAEYAIAVGVVLGCAPPVPVTAGDVSRSYDARRVVAEVVQSVEIASACVGPTLD
jgi:hypothetical protein